MDKNVAIKSTKQLNTEKISFNKLKSNNSLVENNKLDIEDEEDNKNENSLRNDLDEDSYNEELYDEVDYQDVQERLKEIRELGLDAINEYAQDEEKYYNQLKQEFMSLQDLYDKELTSNEVMTLKIERLSEDIERDHILMEEYKEENATLEILSKLEINKNSAAMNSLHDSSIVDKIYSTIEYTDLTSMKKFSKYLAESSDTNFTESISVLRGAGGEYLKRQASVLYYLHLINNRYTMTRIPQEASENAEKNDALKNIQVDLDQMRLFETKVKVVYNNESFLINLENELKKNSYTFKDLKEESCDVFNIRNEHRNQYHIVNDKFYVYSHRIKVWDIHKISIENSRINMNWNHLELIDKMSIFSDRLTNINKDNQAKSNKLIEEEIKQTRNLNELTSEELFTSEVEEYVRYYRRIEAVRLFFTKDVEKNLIIQKFAERIQNLERENILAKEALLLSSDEDTTDAQLDKKLEETKKAEEEKKKDEIFRHLRKPEPPIYLSMKSIFLFRLGKFFYILLNILFAVLFYYKMNNSGVLNIRETYNINKLINSIVMFNPIYKHFLKNEGSLANQQFNKMITNKSDLLLWLDILFNNLIMDTGNEIFPEGVDTFNNFFQRDNTMYELFNGMEISFVTSQPLIKFENETFFELPLNISQDITYYKEYETEYEDTSPKYFDSEKYKDLLIFDNVSCNNCFSNGFLSYGADTGSYVQESGDYGDYEGGSYQFNLNNVGVRRHEFDSLVKLIKEILILNPELRMLLMSFNIIHIYNKSLMNLSIRFEISTIGDIYVETRTGFVDTQDDVTLITQLINYLFYANICILGFTLFLRLSSKLLVFKKVKSINNFALTLDCLLFLLFLWSVYLNNEFEYVKQLILGDSLNINISNSTFSSEQDYQNAFKYYNLNPLIDNTNLNNQISGFTLLLLFFRIIFYLIASPLLVYVMVLTIRITKSIFNLFVILFIFVMSFSLIFHATLGTSMSNFSTLKMSLILSLVSILGAMDASEFGNLTIVQYFVIIAFLFIIKFVLFTFIFAIIKETFDEIKTSYMGYRKRDHFKLVGETVYIFLKYFLMPFSFYTMIKEYLYYKRTYGDINLEKLVKEEELKRKIKII